MSVLGTEQLIYSFGEWIRQRRKVLDMTQRTLADRAGCTIAMIKKIEADERRPSRDLAQLLTVALHIPAEQHAIFVESARGLRPVDRLEQGSGGAEEIPQSAIRNLQLEALPTGTVTFLFTDLEGSTVLWERYPEAMKGVMARHDAILREVVAGHHGRIIKSTGDGCHAVFAAAADALAAFRALAEMVEPRFHGPEAIAWFRQVEQEQDNFRAAVEWGTGEASTTTVEACLHLVNHLWLFWLRRGRWQEGERLLRLAIDAAPPGDSIEIGHALQRLGTFIALQGQFGEASALFSRAMGIARRLEEPELLFSLLLGRGQALPEPQQRILVYEEALDIWQHDGATLRTKPWMLMQVHHYYGDRLRELGRDAEAPTITGRVLPFVAR